MPLHAISIRVYYEDTDAGGVAYNAAYIRFFERARTEWLRECGVDLAEWMAKGVYFVVTDLAAKYRAPARYGDLLNCTTTLSNLGRASLVLEHAALRGDEMLVTASTRLGCIGPDYRPERIPAFIVEALKRATGIGTPRIA
jgi:acyl-CoA thioester hydrolase